MRSQWQDSHCGQNPAGGLCPLDVCLHLCLPARRVICCRSVRRADKNLLRCRCQREPAGRTSLLRTSYLGGCIRHIHAFCFHRFFLLSMYLRSGPLIKRTIFDQKLSSSSKTFSDFFESTLHRIMNSRL